MFWAKVDKSHSSGKARVQLSSRCQLHAAGSANLGAGIFHEGHVGVVIEIANQVTRSHGAEHFAHDFGTDVFAPTVGEIPRVLHPFPQIQAGAMHEADGDDVNAVRVHFVPELVVGYVKEAKFICLVAQLSQLNGCEGDDGASVLCRSLNVFLLLKLCLSFRLLVRPTQPF